MKTKPQYRAWSALAACASLAVMIVLAPRHLAAQSPTEVRQIPDLSGTWAGAGGRQGSCAGLSDSRGLPRIGCRFPVDKLKLTARTLAWLEFHDEPIEGKFYCVPESMPSLLLRNDPVRIDQRADKVVMEYEVFLSHNVTRTVWTDGRPLPPPGEVAYYGYSVGRYEGNELIVETRNFTFDPNGIDYQAQIPSSWVKHLTERYSRVAPDRLKMVLTVEDPIFMKEPYTETRELVRSNRQIEWIDCDPGDARVPLMMLPPKYKD